MGDDGDLWDIDSDLMSYSYVMRNRRTGEKKTAPMESGLTPERWSREVSRMYDESRIAFANQWRKPERRSIYDRWEDRMLRLKQKAKERRLRRVAQAGWILGWVWGTILATVLTINLVAWLGKTVLG